MKVTCSKILCICTTYRLSTRFYKQDKLTEAVDYADFRYWFKSLDSEEINVKKLNSLKQCLTATRPTSHN